MKIYLLGLGVETRDSVYFYKVPKHEAPFPYTFNNVSKIFHRNSMETTIGFRHIKRSHGAFHRWVMTPSIKFISRPLPFGWV